MKQSGNIVIGIDLKKTENGMLVTSPDVEMNLFLENPTVAGMLDMAASAVRFSLYLAYGLGIRTSYLVIDGNTESLAADRILEEGVRYRMILVPEQSPKAPSPCP